MREFSNSVETIVGVGSENICSVLCEGEGFADELHRGCGVSGKNYRVFRRGAEEGKHTFAGLPHAVSTQLRTKPN